MKWLLASLLTLTVLAPLAHADADMEEIRSCLHVWGKNPFGAKPDFRVVAAQVKVMGIGNDISEVEPTKEPELVLIRPSVTVMAKQRMTLGNPNGWYCLKGKTAVLGKTEILLACGARLAASGGGGAILGSDDANTGTTVLGSTRVIRTGKCAKTADKE